MNGLKTVQYSIVVPIYHREKLQQSIAKECLRSVAQYSDDYELILVDDCSPLDSSELYPYADKVIKHNTNVGVAPSWNDGIKLARGKYIVIINDDIVVSPDWLFAMEDCFGKDSCGVSSLFVEHMPGGEGIEERKEWFPGSCYMLSRETIEKVGLFDEQFIPFNCEDIDYWVRILDSGLKMYRNFDVFIEHKEGNTVHLLDYTKIDNINVRRLIKKYGYDPRPQFYNNP